MTTDEIASKFKKICELRKQIKLLQTQRHEDELAISTQYKVSECNQARNASALNYQNQINELTKQIASIEDELGG